jgi:probable FeS assembly SUF system protein SufT
MHDANDVVVLTRDCQARLVPSGTQVVLPARTSVRITQSLGDSCTVVVNGNMARIDGRDADALGRHAAPAPAAPGATAAGIDEVWGVLRGVFDPEIPVNIVDLGLVYGCELVPEPATGGRRVDIRMTLTSPQCGMGPVLVDNIRFRVSRLPGIDRVAVDLVFDPPWEREMMTEEARLELGML